MKRKSIDALKHSNSGKGFRQDPQMDEHVLSGLTERTGRNLHHETVRERAVAGVDNIIDLRRNPNTIIDMRAANLSTLTGQLAAAAAAASVSAASTTKEQFPRSVQVTEFEHQQSLQSRIVLCQRPPERPYSSVSQVSHPYISNSSDPTASPRKRLLETAGVGTEIKAIQQTRRLLANARERTRVHTISAAFEALRKQVLIFSVQWACYPAVTQRV
ncbi:UNVERIFIED_CONTAM: hypothetical protein FKN15_015385 [Acipenser sinensis]